VVDAATIESGVVLASGIVTLRIA